MCGTKTVPFLRPSFLDIEARWIAPASFCLCCLNKREEEEKIRRKQKAIDEAFQNSRMSLRFKERTFENFVIEPNTQKAYEIALRFHPQKNGLLFLGACGVGKTHLAAAIANREIGETPTLFISCPEFLLELRDGISRKKRDYFSLFDMARKVRLLILDDVGAEKTSEWVQETLFVLINHRYEHMLPTLFTTNCSLEELEERIGKRSTSRMVEMCRCIQMNGEDWRIRQRQQNKESLYGR